MVNIKIKKKIVDVDDDKLIIMRRGFSHYDRKGQVDVLLWTRNTTDPDSSSTLLSNFLLVGKSTSITPSISRRRLRGLPTIFEFLLTFQSRFASETVQGKAPMVCLYILFTRQVLWLSI